MNKTYCNKSNPDEGTVALGFVGLITDEAGRIDATPVGDPKFTLGGAFVIPPSGLIWPVMFKNKLQSSKISNKQTET